MELTTEIVRELLDYNPDTGVFTWKERGREWFNTKRAWRTWNARYAGKRASTVTNLGYRIFSIHKQRILEHRAAFLYMGVDPAGHEVDHINGYTLDNSFSNLRLVNRKDNCRNVTGGRAKKGLLPGVHVDARRPNHPRPYRARVRVNGKEISAGQFETEIEAHEAYLAKARELGFHPNHGRVLP